MARHPPFPEYGSAFFDEIKGLWDPRQRLANRKRKFYKYIREYRQGNRAVGFKVMKLLTKIRKLNPGFKPSESALEVISVIQRKAKEALATNGSSDAAPTPTPVDTSDLEARALDLAERMIAAQDDQKDLQSLELAERLSSLLDKIKAKNPSYRMPKGVRKAVARFGAVYGMYEAVGNHVAQEMFGGVDEHQSWLEEAIGSNPRGFERLMGR